MLAAGRIPGAAGSGSEVSSSCNALQECSCQSYSALHPCLCRKCLRNIVYRRDQAQAVPKRCRPGASFGADTRMCPIPIEVKQGAEVMCFPSKVSSAESAAIAQQPNGGGCSGCCNLGALFSLFIQTALVLDPLLLFIFPHCAGSLCALPRHSCSWRLLVQESWCILECRGRLLRRCRSEGGGGHRCLHRDGGWGPLALSVECSTSC